jgi:signal transduction histidine kinase
MRSRLPWLLFGLTCLIAVGHITLLILVEPPVFTKRAIAEGFPLVTVGAVTGAGVGALILSRYPRHRIGWLFLVGQLLTEFDVAAQAYGEAVLTGELGGAPGGHMAIWLSVLLGAILTLTYLAILFLLAPDGHLLSSRWRWAAAVPVVGLALHTLAVCLVSPYRLNASKQVPGGAGTLVNTLSVSGMLLVFLGLVIAAVSLVIRLRRSAGAAREQLWWMAAAAGALAVGAGAGVGLSLLGAPNWVDVIPMMVGYVCVPLFTGIAVLRHRLYDIDVIVNRAIALAVLTAFVTAGYVAIVVVIGRLVTPAANAFWPSMLATAVVALAFQPLRARVSRFADRIVYGAQAVPYEALADFSAGLQEAPESEAFLPRVAETIGRSVSARQVTIWIDVPGAPRSSVSWPAADQHPPDLVVPVLDTAEQLGGFSVSMPPARALRGPERQLLGDFAVQLVQAFRIRRLRSELTAKVDELDQKTVELAASSRRLTHAQEEERARFTQAIRHAVLPYVEPLPATLTRLAGDPARAAGTAGEQLDAMTLASVQALESLRTLTRGVFPAQLAHRGLVSALSAHLADAGLSGVFDSDEQVTAHRFDPRVESAAYFCAVEFLRELDAPERVTLAREGDHLALSVSGRASGDVGASTRHLVDRVAALGGRASINAAAAVAVLRVRLPFGADAGAAPRPADSVSVKG